MDKQFVVLINGFVVFQGDFTAANRFAASFPREDYSKLQIIELKTV